VLILKTSVDFASGSGIEQEVIHLTQREEKIVSAHAIFEKITWYY